MSLINDALKRAREAQQQAPESPVAQPQLRPVEPEKHTRHNVGLLVLTALLLIALGGLVFVWQIVRKHNADVQEVAAKSPPATQPAVQPASTPAGTPADNAPADTAPPANPAATAVVTNATSVPEAAPAAPPPPKLQGIVFNPKRPSALIDGRTLFLGDRFREFRVIAITRQTVTLADAGVTNVLSLSE